MMHTTRVVVVALAVMFAAPTLCASAHAQEAPTAFTAGRMSASFMAGYGFAVQGDSLRNPYDISLGAAAGFTLNNGVYFGAFADYFLGDTDYVSGTNNESLKLTFDWSHMAAEAGYDIAANAIVLRPSLGVGVAIASACLDGACESESHFVVAPAVSVLAPLGEHSFLTVGMRYFFVPKSDGVDPFDGLMFGVGLGAAL